MHVHASFAGDMVRFTSDYSTIRSNNGHEGIADKSHRALNGTQLAISGGEGLREDVALP